MPQASVRDRVLELVSSTAPDRSVQLHAQSRLVEDAGLDSLRLMELAVAVQVEFGLEPFAEAELVGLGTVADVAGLVESKVAG